MSSCATFMQTCQEGHKKNYADPSVNFSKSSKKCLERWKTIPAKKKSKFKNMGKRDKACYVWEIKNYIPPKDYKEGMKKDTNAHERPPPVFLFCSEHCPKTKSEHSALSIQNTVKKKKIEMWSEQTAKDRQPYEQKAAKLKEKFKKDIATYYAECRSQVGKKDPGRPTGSNKKNEPEDEEEEEEEDDEEEDEDEE